MVDILPGVDIEVRSEGLIVPGAVTVNNLGVIGTAAKGPINKPVLLGSFADAKQVFYEYDPWVDGRQNELTLVRALEQAFGHGATTVYAVRVTGTSGGHTTAKAAKYTLQSTGGNCVTLTAKSEGTWGDDLQINVASADENAVITEESHLGNEPPPITLRHLPIVKSARTRIRLRSDATGVTTSLKVLYDDTAAAAAPGEVKVDRTSGHLAFGDAILPNDKITATYLVASSNAVKVTLRFNQAKEVFTVVDGANLADDVNDPETGSKWVTGHKEANSGQLPSLSSPVDAFAEFTGGDDGAGATGAEYEEGLRTLLNEEAHIIVAAGQDDSFGNKLDAHCQQASSDAFKHDRIAVVGSKLGASLDDLRGHVLASDRVIFVAPGMRATDAAASPPTEVTLPGAYTAAAIAGLLAGLPPHVSLTNKILSVDGLETKFNLSDLAALVQSRVLAIEQRQGFRVVKGITTATDTAFAQITTRRIVDFAKFGVRSAADPFIGKLNNERVRGALRASINVFLAEMVNDEMLVSYDLAVSATRDDEKQGIARVVMTLRPTFSIDFIKVTMLLE
jgi:hypothetical protein